MVAGKVNNRSYEIRSGMSVQDLKQLTAQRTQRQQLDTWSHQARESPRQVMAAMDWSSAVSASPERRYGTTYYPNSRRSRSPSTSPTGSERMFITCGGQVVSFMEGVVNMPQMDGLPDTLSPL